MPKILLICKKNWSGNDLDDLRLYSFIHFLVRYFEVEIVIHDFCNSLSQVMNTDIVGTVVYYERYTRSTDLERVTHDVAKHIGPNKPLSVVRNLSCQTLKPDSTSAWQTNLEPPPSWLHPYYNPNKQLDVQNQHLALDQRRFPRHDQNSYQASLNAITRMSTKEIEASLKESKHTGIGLGSWITTLLIESGSMLTLINERSGSHDAIHGIMRNLLGIYIKTLNVNSVSVPSTQLIRGWLYHKTGTIEIPVLQLAASREDWDGAKFSPALRRVAQWAHAQRQAIPVLSDLTVITPEHI